MNRLLGVLWPWGEIRRLREENERLVQAMSDPLLTGIQVGNGTLDIGLQDCAGAELLAGMFLGVFEKYPDAENYMEWRFNSKLGPVLVTAVKPGGHTPDQLRRAAERERDELRAKLNALAPKPELSRAAKRRRLELIVSRQRDGTENEMTAEPKLWAMHVPGPDDVFAMASEEFEPSTNWLKAN